MTDLKDWISDLDHARVPDLWPPKIRTSSARRLPVSRLVTIAAALVIGLVPVALIVVAMHRGSPEPERTVNGNVHENRGGHQILPQILSMEFGPGPSGYMVRCTGDPQRLDRCRQRAVFASTDGGTTWEERSVEPLTLIRPVAENTAYGAMNCPSRTSCVQVVRTDDGGRTWRRLGRIEAAGLDLTYPGGSSLSVGSLLWFQDGGALFRSADGRQWTTVRSPCPSGATLTSVAFAGSVAGYASCEGQPGTGSASKTVLQTQDEGQTWHVVSRTSLGPPGDSSFPDVGTLPSSGYNGTLSFPGGFQAGFLMTQRGGLYLTTDEGRDFRPIALTDDVYSPVGVGVLGPRSYVVALLSGQILSTADGGATWSQRFPTPTLTVAGPFAFSSATDGIAAGDEGIGAGPGGIVEPVTQLYATHDGGATWTALGPLPGPGTGPAWIATPSLQVVYVMEYTAKSTASIYRSDDGGRTWTQVGAPTGSQVHGLSFVSPDEGFVVSGDRLYRTTDGAKNWSPGPATAGVTVTNATPDSSAAEGVAFWGGPTDAFGRIGSTVLRSTDGGGTFVKLLSEPGFSPNTLSSTDAGHVWVSGSICSELPSSSPSVKQPDCAARPRSVLLRSLDGGRTWQTIRLPSMPTEFVFVNSTVGYWLQDGQILTTKDGGVTWRPATGSPTPSGTTG